MKRFLLLSLVAVLCSFVGSAVETIDKLEAFPGAEGYGRYTSGGRGGKVYHVTTLEDNNEPGSFRHACNQAGTRTIVFDVSGNIHLKSDLNLRNGNVTIAGQTAPGDGICITDYPFSIKANNVIIRFMRFRLGNKNVTVGGADGWDGLGALDQKDIIVDHCSVSWSIDECLSFSGTSNTTVQWCIVSQSLVNSGHSKKGHGYGGNWGGEYGSYHHNLLAHHTSRAPRLGPRPTTQLNEVMDMRNNVMFNYSGESCYGGEGMNVNIVNNYYKPGPGNKYSGKTKETRIAAIGVRNNEYCTTYPAYLPALHLIGTYYVDGNENANVEAVKSNNWGLGMYNQIDWSKWDDLGNTNAKREQIKQNMRRDLPIEYVYTTTHSTADAYDKVLAYAGASLKRDALDNMIVSDAKNNTANSGTGSGLDRGFINTPDDVKYPAGTELDGVLPVLKSSTAKVDTDGDGMPDEWETANGLDPNDPTDGAKVSANGYTNLELYMNSLVQDIMDLGNAKGKMLNGELTFADPAVELPVYTPSENPEQPENPGEVYEWEISATTGEAAGMVHKESPLPFKFGSDIEIACSRSDRTYNHGSGATAEYIKFSAATWTVKLPQGKVATEITFEGWANNDGNTSYLQSINDETFANDQYVFPIRNVNAAKSYTVTLSKPANELNIVLKGAESVLKMNIKGHAAEQSGIEDVIAPEKPGNGKIYNIMGVEVKEPLLPGVYIRDGKKFLVR